MDHEGKARMGLEHLSITQPLASPFAVTLDEVCVNELLLMDQKGYPDPLVRRLTL